MSICCIAGYGRYVRNENGLVAVYPPLPERDSTPKTVITPEDLTLVLVAGDHGISTGAVRLLLEKGVELVFLDPYGSPAGYILPCRKSPVIENAERQKNLLPKQGLSIASAIVKQAIHNKLSLLRSITRNSSGRSSPSVLRLREYGERAGTAGSVAVLLGIEGSATREYYDALRQVIPESFGFHGRTRHPPRDPVNALFSYGYGILYATIRTALARVKLSPFYGVLHADYKNQEALVYDFIEEFRQPIVDRVVLSMVNLHQIDHSQFTVTDNGCLVHPSFRKSYAEQILGRMDARFEYEGQSRPFSSIIDRQAELLADSFLKNKPYVPFPYR